MTRRFFFPVFAIFIVWSVLSAACLGGTSPVGASSESSNSALTVSPVLVSPANRITLHHTRPEFDWQDFPGAAGYQIQASRQSNFHSLLVDETTVSSDYASTSDLPGRAKIFWRVRALVSGTYTPWSKAWRFTTGNPPSIPVLFSPADGNEVIGLSPHLDWQDSVIPSRARFDHYQIQIATDGAFAAPIHDEDIAGVANSQDEGASLAVNTTYYWRVRSFSAKGDYSAWSAVWSLTVVPGSEPPGGVIDPASIEYLGAFRLPEGGERPYTFEYGGNAMTVNPYGDPNGVQDGFPGSLFITGHDRLPYNELPNGSQVAEVNIPAPVISTDVNSLSRAEFLQNFQNVAGGHFTRLEEIVRIGLLYLDHPLTGPKIHIAWGQHLEPDPPAPTHGWFDPNLSTPNFKGEWYLDGMSFYAINDYLLEIPSVWADANVQGRVIGAGRFKDGGWSGMGPALIAYRPWLDNGTPPANGAHLAVTPLLLYGDSYNTESFDLAMTGYQHPDEWNGGAWIESDSGESALMFAGTKSDGTKFWYGYINPAGPDYPCVDEAVTDFTTCRMADGSACPPQDFHECSGHNDYRGWWTTHWDSEFIFYDPADLARVASGELASWEPQPYATLDIDEHLFFNPSGVETDMLGTGVQRRYRLGDAAYDRVHNLLYVLELYADGAAPVVHVWRVQ